MKFSIFEIIQNISVVIASVTAILGISSWRKETKWKRKYELAEEVLSLFYECKEKISIIRSPFSNSYEGQTRKKSESETIAETEILNQAYVFHERYEREKDCFIKLKTIKFRFMAIYGVESEIYFKEIGKIVNTILFAANQLGRKYWKEQGTKTFSEAEFDEHIKQLNKYEAIVYAGINEPDEIEIRADECIKQIELYCGKIIKRSSK